MLRTCPYQIWNPTSNWAVFSLGKTADLEAEDIAQALSCATWRAKEVEAVPDKSRSWNLAAATRARSLPEAGRRYRCETGITTGRCARTTADA
jgi:hypothetical protein